MNLIPKFAFSILTIFWGCHSAFAIDSGRLLFDATALRPSMKLSLPPPLCQEAFAIPFVSTHHSTVIRDAFPSRDTEMHPVWDRDPTTDRVVDHTLHQWQTFSDYTDKNVEFLRKMDRSLDARRKMYIAVQAEQSFATLRIFDGSSTVYKAGFPEPSLSQGSAKTPIERIAKSFELPERIRERETKGAEPAFLWELGLLDASIELTGGVTSVLTQAATVLDTHYNQGQYAYFQNTSVLESKKMTIYAQTRRDRLAKFMKYGFKAVPALDEKGEVRIGADGQPLPLEVSPGLYLMRFDAVDFLKAFGNSDIAKRKDDPAYKELEKTLGMISDIYRDGFQELDQKRIALDSEEKIRAHEQSLFQQYRRIRQLWDYGTPTYNILADQFLRDMYVFVNSLSPDQRDPENAQTLKTLILRSLSSDILTGITSFSYQMDRWAQMQDEITQHSAGRPSRGSRGLVYGLSQSPWDRATVWHFINTRPLHIGLTFGTRDQILIDNSNVYFDPQ